MCVLVPQGIKLALAQRELIRQGYLFGARVLQRSLIERTAILLYLERDPTRVKVWTDGWLYGRRPSLPTMLKDVVENGHLEFVVANDPTFLKEYNSVVHGDPGSAALNLMFVGDDVRAGVSKDLEHPDICDQICTEAIVWLGLLILSADRVLPA